MGKWKWVGNAGAACLVVGEGENPLPVPQQPGPGRRATNGLKGAQALSVAGGGGRGGVFLIGPIGWEGGLACGAGHARLACFAR